MIRISDRSECCGCSACYAICPNDAITMTPDSLGFKYPEVDPERCIDCGLCEKVCPYGKEYPRLNPSIVYAAANKDENVRMGSSSGGVFSVLATKVLHEDGVVYGAAFSDQEKNAVEHICVESPDSLKRIYGSKYLQSDMNDAFSEVSEKLKEGRKVLFSGTPCQIAGLKAFIGGNDAGLMTVACACHGVPSPEIWKRYLGELKGNSDIVTFRDKTSGWKSYNVRFGDYYSPAFNDPYMKAMLQGLTLRPSCLACVFKGRDCGCDIMLGDWWGIGRLDPGLDDDKGTGAVLVFGRKGLAFLDAGSLKLKRMACIDDPGNGGFNIKSFRQFDQNELVREMEHGRSIYKILKKLTEAKMSEKVVRRIKRILGQ